MTVTNIPRISNKIKVLLLLLSCFIGYNAKGALVESVCATLVVTELKAVNPSIDATQESKLITQWTAICKGILDHIKTAGVVNTLVNGATGPGTPGGPLPIIAQPGIGAIQ